MLHLILWKEYEGLEASFRVIAARDGDDGGGGGSCEAEGSLELGPQG